MASKNQSNASKNHRTCPICGKSLPDTFFKNCPFCGAQLHSNAEIEAAKPKNTLLKKKTLSVPVKKIPNADFSLGETLVTQAQYQEIVGKNPSHFRGNANLPVENVSWKEAMEFCEKLTVRECKNGTLPDGYKYFLPTCAQWGKAVEGIVAIDSRLWSKESSKGKTHPVKRKKASAFGLYDLLGNVWEWCADSGKNPFLHFCRGGSWNCSEKLCSSSFSLQAHAEYRSDDLGFRVALVPENTSVPLNSLLDVEGNFEERKEISYLNYIAPAVEQIVMLKVPGQDFLLGKYPVTQGEYKKVMGKNPSFYLGNDNLPVENVSGFDAMAFCKKLTELERAKNILPDNYEYTLPTSEQWEIACRSGTKTKFYFGDSDENLRFYAWYKYNSGSKTHPVGQRLPNAWGFYDILGNVKEWCLENRTPPLTYILRGGAWNSDSKNCESSKASFVEKMNSARGFRIAIVRTFGEKDKDFFERRTKNSSAKSSCGNGNQLKKPINFQSIFLGFFKFIWMCILGFFKFLGSFVTGFFKFLGIFFKGLGEFISLLAKGIGELFRVIFIIIITILRIVVPILLGLTLLFICYCVSH